MKIYKFACFEMENRFISNFIIQGTRVKSEGNNGHF